MIATDYVIKLTPTVDTLTRETVTTKRGIMKCRHCKAVAAADIDVTRTVTTHVIRAHGSERVSDSSITRYRGHTLDGREAWGERRYNGKVEINAECSCRPHAIMSGGLVNGHVTSQPCSIKCTTATGMDCECSCGGANHGGAH